MEDFVKLGSGLPEWSSGFPEFDCIHSPDFSGEAQILRRASLYPLSYWGRLLRFR
jgi:hypothetical protein